MDQRGGEVAMHVEEQRRGGQGQDSSPSGLREILLLLLSMEGRGMEAECVCGEFLWATADILLDDEIPRVSACLLPGGSKATQHSKQEKPPRSAPKVKGPGRAGLGPERRHEKIGFRWAHLDVVVVACLEGVCLPAYCRRYVGWRRSAWEIG